MDVSQNSITDLLIWKKDIEDQYTEEAWGELYPLYSQIVFWISFKQRKFNNARKPKQLFR